jgi:hypothetical protein
MQGLQFVNQARCWGLAWNTHPIWEIGKEGEWKRDGPVLSRGTNKSQYGVIYVVLRSPYLVVIVIAIRDTSPILLRVGVIRVVLTDK